MGHAKEEAEVIMMKMLILNGPNLNLLGSREPDVYGTTNLQQIVDKVVAKGVESGVDIDAVQSNGEGELVTKIGESMGVYDGIIFNPAAYTHTSVAIRDAILACGVPCVEVHLSNIHKREEFRQKSLSAPVCIGQISGFGGYGYILGLEALLDHLAE